LGKESILFSSFLCLPLDIVAFSAILKTISKWAETHKHQQGSGENEKHTVKKNWAVPTVIGRSSVWGVESDSGEDYFKELAKDQIAEALADIERIKKALATI